MLRRLLKFAAWSLALAWLAGCVFVAANLPPVPRPGWQPPAGQHVIGFLGDTPWLVAHEGDISAGVSQVQRWNMTTGAAEPIPMPPGRIDAISADVRTALLRAVTREGKSESQSLSRRMYLIDGSSGNTVWNGSCVFEPTEAIPPLFPRWPTDDAGHFMAFETYEKEWRVELHDLRAGTKLREMTGYRWPAISPDGSLFAAFREEQLPAKFVLKVWTLRDGAEVASISMNVHALPMAFSHDNSVLRLNEGSSYDLRNNRWVLSWGPRTYDFKDKRWSTKAPPPNAAPSDETAFMHLESNAQGVWLVWNDGAVAEEKPGRRRKIATEPQESMHLRPTGNPDYVVVQGRLARTRNRLLEWFPGVEWMKAIFNPVGPQGASQTALLDSETGESVLSLDSRFLGQVHPKLPIALATERAGGQTLLFSLPPDRAWLSIAGLSLLGLAPSLFLLWRRRSTRFRPALPTG